MLDETRVPLLGCLDKNFVALTLADLAAYQSALWATVSDKPSALQGRAVVTFFGTAAVATGTPRTPEAFARCVECKAPYTAGQGIYRSRCGKHTQHQDCVSHYLECADHDENN